MRRRAGSVTPTYSTDRDLLFSKYTASRTVSTVEEAQTALSNLAIFDDTAFKRKVSLETDDDWSSFLGDCRDGDVFSLEMILKKCYTAAYSMPPSPNSQIRTKSSSSSPPAVTI